MVHEDGQPSVDNSADQNAENDADDEEPWKMMEAPESQVRQRLRILPTEVFVLHIDVERPFADYQAGHLGREQYRHG